MAFFFGASYILEVHVVKGIAEVLRLTVLGGGTIDLTLLVLLRTGTTRSPRAAASFTRRDMQNLRNDRKSPVIQNLGGRHNVPPIFMESTLAVGFIGQQ